MAAAASSIVAATLSFESFGLCTGSTSLTLNNSTVSNNVGGAAGDGGGIDNDLQGTLKLNGSTVSGNTTGGSGGGHSEQRHGDAHQFEGVG